MITAGEFSKLLEVSRQQVNNYREQGMPSIKKGAYYHYTFDSIQWLVSNGLREIEQPIENQKKLTIHERNKLADTKLKEHKLQVQQGRYIERLEVEKDTIEVAIMMRNQLISIPDRVIPKISLPKEQKHELKRMMLDELHNSINNFSDSLGISE